MNFLYLLLFACFSCCCIAHPLVKAARNQIGKTLTYNPSYRPIPYPMGDLPLSEGVCSDVVIRALRQGYNIDLQKHIHEDMKKRWAAYPKLWGLKKPDPHIDHRRVPNIAAFFRHHGMQVPQHTPQPGDIATWKVLGLPHIGIISDRHILGRPLVIHNIGQGTQEEDFIGQYKMTELFRLTPSFIKSYNNKKQT